MVRLKDVRWCCGQRRLGGSGIEGWLVVEWSNELRWCCGKRRLGGGVVKGC